MPCEFLWTLLLSEMTKVQSRNKIFGRMNCEDLDQSGLLKGAFVRLVARPHNFLAPFFDQLMT